MRIQLVSNNTIYLERFSIFVTFLLVLTGEVEVHHFWLRGVISRTSISLKKEVFKLHNVKGFATHLATPFVTRR